MNVPSDAGRYSSFVKAHRNGRVLFLELGVGMNTPGIIKYPFWQMTAENPGAVYACLNSGQALCPDEIREQAICLDGDIGGHTGADGGAGIGAPPGKTSALASGWGQPARALFKIMRRTSLFFFVQSSQLSFGPRAC